MSCEDEAGFVERWAFSIISAVKILLFLIKLFVKCKNETMHNAPIVKS